MVGRGGWLDAQRHGMATFQRPMRRLRQLGWAAAAWLPNDCRTVPECERRQDVVRREAVIVPEYADLLKKSPRLVACPDGEAETSDNRSWINAPWGMDQRGLPG